MSKFLTPPVWYDENGNLNEVLTGTTTASGGIALGPGAASNGSGIVVGSQATANAGQVQLGNNSSEYDLTVGNGTGTSKIGVLSFNEVDPTSISSGGLYWCTAIQTVTGTYAGTFCCSAFLWIKTPNDTAASATNGSATFSYDDQGGTSDWKIRVSGTNVSNLKCYRVFA